MVWVIKRDGGYNIYGWLKVVVWLASVMTAGGW